MKPRKTPEANLQKKRLLFFEIGLVVALALVAALFGVGRTERTMAAFAAAATVEDHDLVPVTRPPEPVKEVAMARQYNVDVIEIVRNNSPRIIDDVPDIFDVEMPVVPKIVVPDDTPVEDDRPVPRVESMPRFMGGEHTGFREWIMKQLVYPPLAAEVGMGGRVMLYFEIDKAGNLTNARVMQSPDRLFSDEVLRVVGRSPRWEPGRNGSFPASVLFMIPIDFNMKN